MSTDRIENAVIVHAPRSRVWRALANAQELGTRVSVTESGFEAIPLARRAKALRDNDRGWTQQVENLARHVSG